MARRSLLSTLRLFVAAGAVTALSSACGIIAGIEDFNLVEADAGGPETDATPSPSDVIAADAITTIDDGSAPNDGAALDDVTQASDVHPDSPPADASPVDTGSDVVVPPDTSTGCSCPSPLQTCALGNVCTPAILAQGRSDPRSIVHENGNVVWAEWGASQIVFCPATGCGPTPSVSAASVTNPTIRHSFAGGPTTVFYENVSGPIDSIQPSGATTTIVTGPVTAAGAALTSGAAAWATGDTIWICLLGGCNAQKLTSSTNPISGPAMFRVSSRVFWMPPSGGVSSCLTTACNGKTNWGQPGPAVVDADTDNTNLVVATVGSNATVTSYDMGGTLEKSTTIGKSVNALVMNATKIYLATSGGIVVIDRATFGVTSPYPGNARGIAVGPSEIYWTDASGFVFHAPN